MATIKGQNLRLILDGSCIAAATSCTVHLQANVQDSSTKDTEGLFIENAPVGLQWDASVEALVVENVLQNTFDDVDDDYGGWWQGAQTFSLTPGMTIESGSESVPIGLIDVSDDRIILEPETNRIEYTADRAENVAICSTAGEAGEVYVLVYEAPNIDTLLRAAKNRTPLTCRFSRTFGDNNRVEHYGILQGSVIVSDISVTAQNRQNGVLSATLTGTSSLQQV